MKKYLDTKAESLESKITKIFGETVAKEGNKFTKALMAAREAGKKFFSVNGKQYETEAYKEDNTNNKSDDGEGMDKVQPKAVKKKFADRKDKDIDNDGDVDSSDKYLHKRRKAISKAIKMDEKKNYKYNKNFFVNDKTDTLKKMSGEDGYGEVELTNYLAQKTNKDEDDVYFDGLDLVYKDKTVLRNAYRQTVEKMLKALQKVREGFKESVSDIIQNKNLSMREALAKVWEASVSKNPFEQFGANTPTSNQGVKTVKRDQAAAAKARAKGDTDNPGSFGKKKPISSQKKTDTGKPVTKVEINPKV